MRRIPEVGVSQEVSVAQCRGSRPFSTVCRGEKKEHSYMYCSRRSSDVLAALPGTSLERRQNESFLTPKSGESSEIVKKKPWPPEYG